MCHPQINCYQKTIFQIIDVIKNTKVATTDPSEMLKFDLAQTNFKQLFVEDIIRKKQWLLYCSYNANINNVTHIKKVSGGLKHFEWNLQ